MLKNQLRPALVATLVLMIITGVIYPGIVTGIAQLVFPHQANGSLVTAHGDGTSGGTSNMASNITSNITIGSELIGQGFTQPWYFHPRPSAAGAGYDDTLSGGTNKGPTDRKLADTLIAQAVDNLVKNDGAVHGQIPSDMVTSSGSGLDPHISPASAALQVARVAHARGVTPEAVRAIVAQVTEGRQFGMFGEPRVNVLKLNLALDQTLPRR